MKRCLALVMSLVLILAAAWIPASEFGTKVEAASFTDMNQSQITEAMGLGWNLGNSLEANLNGTPGETSWGNPTITSTIFNAVKAAGFDTVRIPVSWLSYIGSDSSYTIDSSWMARVKEVVDMAIAADLYVVINVHGDGYSTVTGGWLLPGASDQTTIVAKFKAVWTQIATTFIDYNEHLIFEGMNEIGADANYDWETVNSYYTNINTYNQTFVDAVRATGGNNAKRWLIVTGWNTNIDYTTNQWLNFQMPSDSANRLMISVHYYSPWEFCGNESYDVVNWGSSATSSVATWGNEDYMIEQIDLMYDNFVSQGYPAFIGEFGCIDKSNTAMRCYWAETFVELCKEHGCIPVWWDNGWNGSYGFALFDRSSGSQTQPEIISAMVAAMGSTSSGTTATTTTTQATTTATTTTQAAATTTTTTKATTTTTQASGSSSDANNYVITINGTSALKYIVVNGYHLSVTDGSATYWENAAVNGSATVLVPKANAYSLTIDFKSEQWGSAITSWSGNITSDITLTFDGSNVTASTGGSTATTTTTAAPTTTTTTTKATTTTTKATTTTTTTTTTKATTTTTKATTTTTQASSSSSDNYAVTIKTTGNGSSLGYIMIQGYHLAVSDNSTGTYWENVAASDGTVINIPKAQSWEITVSFKTSEWGSSSASWTGTVTSDMTLTFDGSSVSAS